MNRNENNTENSRTARESGYTKGSVMLHRWLIIFTLVFTGGMYASEANEANETDPRGWKFLGAPYVYANSDFGLVFGGGGGISKTPNIYILYWGSISGNGLLEGGISSAEFQWKNWRFLDVSWVSKSPRYIYTLHDNDPEIVAKATVTQYELQISALRRIERFELGPTILKRVVSAKDAKDANDRVIPLTAFDRFGEANIELAGLRCRYSTTSPIRPLDGVVLESALRVGRAKSDLFDEAKFDGDAELKIAWAEDDLPEGRLYIRGWAIFQLETPPPAQQFLGWERNHRGQPFMREWGRRFLSGRLQYHRTFARRTDFPLVHLHRLMNFVSPDYLDWEFVPFYDVGVVGDPAYGWHKTRHAIGIGLHAVLPPDLVFRLDFALAPGGPLRFFIGAGETI